MLDHPLRILHLTLASDAGGLSHYVAQMSLAMRALGHDVTVAGDRGALHHMFEREKIRWIEIPLKGGPLAFRRCVRMMRAFLEEHPVDVMHTHYRRATLLARRLQVQSRPPVLYTLHLSHIDIRGPRRWFTDFGDHTHAASTDAVEWLCNDARVPPERISLIHHGIDVNRFALGDDTTKRAARIALGIDPNALVASFVGRFDFPKNEQWLLDLACVTRGQSPDLHIILLGEGPHEPALRDRIDSENLHDRVHIVPYTDPLPIYQASDLLLLPSSREGFSLVCAEAMSVGVPVLRTQTSGTTELIIENLTGRSVPIDHDAFIDAAVVMLQDRDALSRMGAEASRHVRENFTFDQQLSQTIELYRRLAQSNSSGGR